jgi:phospholipid transport system substrate-binding protein
MRRTLALVSLLALAAPSALAAASSPMAMLKRSNDEVRQILKGGSVTPELRQKVKKIVNGFLDYEELAKRSLAAQWGKLSVAQRSEFVQVFRDLIERNYVKQLRSNVEYVIDYKDEQVQADEATVHSVIKAQRKGRSAETTIDYKLASKEGRWAVYDVITDDVSLLRNYRSQFAGIINREGYPALLTRMKKKLAETGD